MSYTYTQDVLAPEAETTFVPSYARKANRTKKVKTWMVLVPVAGLVLIGGAAVMLMSGGGETKPLDEPAVAPALVSQPAALSSAPLTSTPAAPVTATPVAPSATAPATRRAEPARRVEAAPVRRSTPAPTAAPRVQAPVEATGPRAYEASPAAVAAPAAPSASTVIAPAPVLSAPPAPSIPVAPLN